MFENLPDEILQHIAEWSALPSVSDPVVCSREVVYTDSGNDEYFNKTSTMRVLPHTIKLSSGSVACHLPSMKPTFGDPYPWKEHFLFNPTKSLHSVVTPNNNYQYIIVGTLVNGTLYRFGGLSKLAKRFTNAISPINCIMHSGIEIEGANENTSSSVMMYIKSPSPRKRPTAPTAAVSPSQPKKARSSEDVTVAQVVDTVAQGFLDAEANGNIMVIK